MKDQDEFERIAALESQQRDAEFQAQTGNPSFQAKEWITLPQAARRFNVPLPTLRYHAKRSHFEAYKPNKRTWLAEAGSVEEWAKERRK